MSESADMIKEDQIAIPSTLLIVREPDPREHDLIDYIVCHYPPLHVRHCEVLARFRQLVQRGHDKAAKSYICDAFFHDHAVLRQLMEELSSIPSHRRSILGPPGSIRWFEDYGCHLVIGIPMVP